MRLTHSSSGHALSSSLPQGRDEHPEGTYRITNVRPGWEGLHWEYLSDELAKNFLAVMVFTAILWIHYVMFYPLSPEASESLWYLTLGPLMGGSECRLSIEMTMSHVLVAYFRQ